LKLGFLLLGLAIMLTSFVNLALKIKKNENA
jgi:hypothetical protein